MYGRTFLGFLVFFLFFGASSLKANLITFSLAGQAAQSQTAEAADPEGAGPEGAGPEGASEETTTLDIGSESPPQAASPRASVPPAQVPQTTSDTGTSDLLGMPSGTDPFSFIGIAKIFGAFLLVIVLLWLFLKLVKRLSKGKTFVGGKEFVMRATMALDTRRYLAAVEIDGKLLVFGVTGDRITPLAHWPVGQANLDDEFSIKDLGLEEPDENPHKYDYDLSTPKERRKKSLLKEPAFYQGLTEDEEAAKEKANKGFNLGFEDAPLDINSAEAEGQVQGSINPSDLSMPDIAPNTQKPDKSS
ncbi:MAG: flagellar biosynthetic protein FliO [Deltaproteobacteria bacterium]|jgi:flagellar biogenesis protein FliO|nr:flagellar biosynthetic protein FliO [Deltaproteobacteria bacterium]